ncbi:AsmA family protein [Christiangramia fulva]|uniref:AsmA family protein n=1 Tax=Christiangramia fulva TaxID=2126553 RepID=A0A2R3Z582_9FLAO|nr:AsmA-like C-terminal region-containing protein [Christiangramia fulva]AVR45372.1 AsmA family protein [Christiangramia fulva]
MKKFLKILGIALLTVVILLVAAPFVFETQLKDLLRKSINKNVNAKVEFSDIDLSMFRSFPKATLVIHDLSIINNKPFEGDTLALSDEVVLEMSIKELFKSSDQPKRIDQLKLNNPFINIKVDSLGRNNYDIATKDTTTTSDSTSIFRLDLKHYELNDAHIKYVDQQGKIALNVENLQHQGNGDFSLEKSKLETYSEGLVTLDYDGTNYLNQNKILLDAVFLMDLEQNKYTFLENEARINQLPLTFDGYVDVNENNNELDITFQTPSSDFKNFLAVIPEAYSKNIENVKTEGNFTVNGRIHGIVDETYIPEMDIMIKSKDASFKYPDLPKSVQDISLDIDILNETGLATDTYVNINNVNFRIDQDRFSAQGKLSNITGNTFVNLNVNGTVNLANLSKAYPLDLEQDLNGILTANVQTSFDMNSIEKKQYQNVNSKGTATIRNFSYRSPEIPNEVKVANADLIFNQGTVNVPDLKMSVGKSDIAASGKLENLMGFLFSDQSLKGNFKANSNYFAVSDFKTPNVKEVSTTENDEKKNVPQPSEKDAIKIPSFLDVSMAFNAKKVIYDNMVLNNATGTLVIKDEAVRLENVKTNIFNGSIGLDGIVSTKQEVPTFKMNLDLNQLDISSSFNELDLLQGLAPIAKAIQGKLQSNLSLQGNLDGDLAPILGSLSGQALAQLLTAEVNPAQMQLLAQLDSQLNFIDLSKIDLNNLKTKLTFSNGMVQVDPFDFKIKDITVNVSGSHSFDMSMNYNLKFEVPAKYLGSQVGTALSQLSGETIQNMTVALPVDLTGTFENPKINLNMQQAVNNLTQKIVAQQKQKAENKAIDAINDILKGKRNPNQPFYKTKEDSIKATDSTKTQAPATKKDSVSQEKQIQNAAKNILGGILKNAKKKPDTTKQQ